MRAHAAVEGIAVLGDSLYSGADVPLLSELIQKKRAAEMRYPVFTGIALHLSEVLLPKTEGNSEAITLRAALPKHFKLLLNRLRIACSK